MNVARKDILFIFAPGPRSGGSFNGHLGVAYLRAALAKHGITTDQYLNANPGTIDEVAADIIRQKSPIVGFTVYDTNAHLSIALAASIKRQKPEVCIVFGGPTVTFNAIRLMERNAVIDVCVMGEAEETAPAILATLLGTGSLDEAQPGVAFRNNGELVCTPLPPLVGCGKLGTKDVLDVVPSPYLTGIFADGDGLLTGRGCTHHCQYCCFAALGRQRLRLHSVERVVAELEYIAEHQKRKWRRVPVAFFDDAFTLVPSRAKVLCQTIADRNLNLNLSCITRADTIDEELIELMQQAGFNTINFGLESAVPSVLRATGKVRPPDWQDPDLTPEKQFVERVRSAVLLAKKYGFYVSVNIIFGLPTETPADATETLRFVKQLPVDEYVQNFLWLYPGTPLWTTHDQYGITCEIDKAGVPQTTGYAYELKSVRPAPKCELEEAAQMVRFLTAHVLHGCGALPAKGNGTYAVVLESEDLSPQTADWLREILAVSGVVLQVYPAMKKRERWAMFERDRRTLCDQLVPQRHYIQMCPSRKSGRDDCWNLTSSRVDVYSVHKPALLSLVVSNTAVPLIAWAEGRRPEAMVCEIAEYLSSNPKELLHLMDRIEAADGPSPLRQMPVPPQVKYPGRWLRGDSPPCMSLGRLEVNDHGEVRCCRHGEPIGKVGHSAAELSKRLADIASAVERRRGCTECGNKHCPRCPFPGIDDRTYCRIMTKQERAQRTLDWTWAYSRLSLHAALVRN